MSPPSRPQAETTVASPRAPRFLKLRERWRSVVEHDLWIDRDVSAIRTFLRGVARLVVLSGRGFAADQCTLRARALTYITVLSLVPLLAFSFSVTKGFGLHERLIQTIVNPFLDRTFGPLASEGPVPFQSESAHGMRTAMAQVLDFVHRTDVSSLGIFGLVFLAYAVINLLGTVETSFNVIWSAPRARSLVRKITDYLAMTIIAPLFVLTATAFTTAAQASAMQTNLGQQLGLAPILEYLFGFAPVLALWGSFTFLYLAMPNAKTRWSSALLAGLVAALVWQLTLVVHVRFQIGLARYNAIYSTFAAIPIFLVWVQISWVIVLFGAELCVAHHYGLRRAQALDRATTDQESREQVALSAATLVTASFLSDAPPWTSDRLARELSVPLAVLDPALAALVAHRVLSVAVSTDGKKVYLPARDPEQIRVTDVLDATRRTPADERVETESNPDPQVQEVIAGLDRATRESEHNGTLKDLAQQSLAARK
jgi:membrane protein